MFPSPNRGEGAGAWLLPIHWHYNHGLPLAGALQGMRDNWLEWLHRLFSEPRRLWKRHLVTNTLFILGAARQLLGKR
jgi:hypothetical protein